MSSTLLISSGLLLVFALYVVDGQLFANSGTTAKPNRIDRYLARYAQNHLPKSCSPNPCQKGGTCRMVEDRRSRKNPRPIKPVCTCPGGWTGRHNCKWPCTDVYKSCQALWKEERRCQIHKKWTDWYDDNCPVTCGVCQTDNRTLPEYLPLPVVLEPLELLIGIWKLDRSQDNKHFPIDFGSGDTFEEEIKFELSEVPMFGTPCINYTARAVSLRNSNDVQVERGFISVIDRWEDKGYPVGVGLMRVTNNGGVFWEDGKVDASKRRIDWHLTGVRTMHGQNDGVEMRNKFPSEANRTMYINDRNIQFITDQVKGGRKQSYSITYFRKYRPYFN